MEKQKKVKSLPAAEVSLFCQQAAMMLKAGIPLYDGMELLYKNYKDTPYGPAFLKIYKGVEEGGSLYEGVKNAGFFPTYMIHMIQIGETAGELDEVLEDLGNYYEREERMRSSIRSAVAYPLLLVVLMTVVIGVLVVRVLPVFSEVFLSLGTGLTGGTGVILSGGTTMGKAVLIVAAVLLAIVLGLYIIWQMGGHALLLRVGCILPAVRRLFDQQAAGRFAEVSAMVLESGYSLEHALKLIPDLISDERNQNKARKCGELMEQTKDLPDALEQTGLFDPLHRKMIRVGAEAGQMDQVMKRLAKIYATEVDEGIHKLVSWVEPALVGILTLIIGGILLSVMLPLASIMMSIS